MHFLRGSGVNGLAGMPFRSEEHGWNSNKPLIRPLLETWRDEIESYCNQKGLSPIQDPSNLDSQYYRNRVRNELIPLLQNFNPKLKEHIIHLSRIVQEEIGSKKREMVDVFAKVLEYEDEDQLVFKLREFQALDLSSQRQILRNAQTRLAPLFRDLDFKSVERMIYFLENPSSSRAQDWIGGIHLFLTKKTAILYHGKELPLDHQLPQMVELSKEWDITSTFSLANGWIIQGEILPCKKGLMKSPEFQEPNHAWLDVAKIPIHLVVRRWKKGDRIPLFGMSGKETKLSNFWINEGIPRHTRIHYPLICGGNEILWIPGIRSSELFRITEKTKSVLHLCLTRGPR